MRVRLGPSSWKVTAPSTWPFSPLERHTIRSSGTCSRIVASQVRCDQNDLGLEVELVVVLLGLDLLDLLHEAREVAELGPLVVGDSDRDADVDRLDDVRRLGGLGRLAAPAATAGDLVLDPGGRALDGALDGRLALGFASPPLTTALPIGPPPAMSSSLSVRPPTRPVDRLHRLSPSAFSRSGPTTFSLSIASLSPWTHHLPERCCVVFLAVFSRSAWPRSSWPVPSSRSSWRRSSWRRSSWPLSSSPASSWRSTARSRSSSPLSSSPSTRSASRCRWRAARLLGRRPCGGGLLGRGLLRCGLRGRGARRLRPAPVEARVGVGEVAARLGLGLGSGSASSSGSSPRSSPRPRSSSSGSSSSSSSSGSSLLLFLGLGLLVVLVLGLVGLVVVLLRLLVLVVLLLAEDLILDVGAGGAATR